MSRYTKKLKENMEFVYGFDHALGMFYEVWDYKKGDEDHECVVEDKSTFLNRLTKSQMLEVMEKYGADKSHIEMVALDLPF